MRSSVSQISASPTPQASWLAFPMPASTPRFFYAETQHQHFALILIVYSLTSQGDRNSRRSFC